MVTSWAPGTVLINDTTPPPEPVFIASSKFQDGLLVRWGRDDVTPDLAGYKIEYEIPNWNLDAPLPKWRRVLPVPKSVDPLFQRARLGGIFKGVLPNNEVMICIRAYDASGNLSTCTPKMVQVPQDEEPPLGRVEHFALTPNATALVAAWVEPTGSSPNGYYLSYAMVGCSLQGSFVE